MGKYAFIDNIFGTDENEGDEAKDAFDEEEDDDEEDAQDEGEHDLPEEDDVMLARLDKEFRKLRARVRALTDLSELREIRGQEQAALAGPLTPTVRLRTIDIIEAIDEQVTNLRARRGPRNS